MSRHLLLLTGLASVAVVVHHSTSWVVTASIWWADRFSSVAVPNLAWVGSPGYALARLIDQFTYFPVPAFLFVSGYFLAVVSGKTGTGLTWKSLLRRCVALAVPYVIWSIVLVAMNIAEGTRYDFVGLVRVFFLGEAAGPYYYVPMILQLYLLSMWIIPAANRHGRALIVVLALISIGTLLSRYPLILQVERLQDLRPVHFLANWQLPAYAVWFGAGAVAGFRLPGFRRGLFRWRHALWLGAAVALVLGVLESEMVRIAAGRGWISPESTLLDNVFSAFLILSFLTLEGVRIPAATTLARLGGMAYGIYLMHVPVVELAARGLYHVAPRLLAFPLAIFLLVGAAGVAVPVLAMTILRQPGPNRVYAYVFG